MRTEREIQAGGAPQIVRPVEVVAPESGGDAPIEVRPLLVGTLETLDALARQLEAAGDVPEPLGTVTDVRALAEQCDRLRPEIAITSFRAKDRELAAEARSILRRLGIAERCVTPLSEMLSRPPRPADATAPRVDPLELVGRAPREVDLEAVAPLVRDRCVLVTGAGGSIGSELAQTLASIGPERLVLMERSENALFEIDRAIASKFPELAREAVLHDVTESMRTAEIVSRFGPAVIYHAAAHKHVPLMEDHPAHAVVNNVFGTLAVAEAALGAGAERFVLISSDKAVNPTSVMGATKRLAELVVGAVQRRASGRGLSTRLCSVRFGNVLGSAGSVIPIWTAQLAEGGPITVTDERMERFFMTIPEAAALVVRAASLSDAGAETFVLDMGDPVKIIDLARRFAIAHGYTPSIDGSGDVEIRITGARPGEKLSEVLAYERESLAPTAATGIRALRASAPVGREDPGTLDVRLDELRDAVRRGVASAVLEAVGRAVPEYRSGDRGEDRPGRLAA